MTCVSGRPFGSQKDLSSAFVEGLAVMSSIDRLSGSPSLVAILSFVEPADLFCCSLVSHRFHDVLKRNHRTMRKFSTAIGIVRNETEQQEGFVFIKVFLKKRSERGSSFSLEVHNENIIVSGKGNNQNGFWKRYTETMNGHSVSGIPDGLRVALLPILDRYYIQHLQTSFDQLDIPREWYVALGTTFNNRNPPSQIEKLSANLASICHLPAVAIRAIEVFWSGDVILDRIAPLLHSFNSVSVHLDRVPTDFGPSILQVIKKWHSGELHINKLELIALYYGFRLGTILKEQVLSNAKSMFELFERKGLLMIVQSDEAIIRRKTDDGVLCIAYNDEKIEMYETRDSGPLERITFDNNTYSRR